METSQGIKECMFTLTSVVRCEITTCVCKNLKIIGKKGGANNNGQCLKMYMTSSEKPGKKNKKKRLLESSLRTKEANHLNTVMC